MYCVMQASVPSLHVYRRYDTKLPFFVGEEEVRVYSNDLFAPVISILHLSG